MLCDFNKPIRPVTNEKPDSDLAEDINVLSQNFKTKNKYRQTVGKSKSKVSTNQPFFRSCSQLPCLLQWRG